MLARPPTRKGLMLSQLYRESLRHPGQLPATCLTRSSRVLVSSRRRIVTRPDLLSWRRRNSQVTSTLLQDRHLATALDGPRPSADELSLNRLLYPQPLLQPPSPPAPHDLRPFDPSNPLLLRSPPQPPPRSRMTPQGIPGDVDSMVSVFDACIQVDQLERAALVLKRFNSWATNLRPEDLMDLHNRYLRANIDRHYKQPNIAWAESMHAWYERSIRARGLPQTADTIAYMLKISLLSAGHKEGRLQRLINRYMGMMPGHAGLEVLCMDNILSDQDLAVITSICSEYNVASEEASEPDVLGTSEQADDVAWHEDFTSAKASIADLGITPDVVSTPQKGLGLKALNSALSFFKEMEGRDVSTLSLQERREVQSKLERDCVDSAARRWKEENEALLKMGRTTALGSPSLNSQLYDWHVSLKAALEEEFALFEAAESRTEGSKTDEETNRILLGPLLKQSNPSRLAALTILSVLNHLALNGASSGAPLTWIVMSLAKNVEEDIRTTQKRKKMNERRASRRTVEFRPSSTDKATKPTISEQLSGAVTAATSAVVGEEPNSAPSHVGSFFFDRDAWPTSLKTKVGAFLLQRLVDTAKITVARESPETREKISQVQPALAHSFTLKRGKKVGNLIANNHMVELLKREPRADFLARHLPMLAEPEPWSKFDKGGFIEFPANLLRLRPGERDGKMYAEAAMQRGDLDQVCKGLDVLGRTAWRINQPVFKVMLEAWNSGERLANIPPLNPQIVIPPEPEASEDGVARRAWLRAVKTAENERAGLHSERCFMNFQLEIARAFKDQCFYFPHNMDFRGRAYPLPAYLNHMGADHVRGLLRFSEARPLGESGLKWLKVHLSNVFGYDKASLDEREAFTMDHINDIFESVNAPLQGKRWWLKAENPWQCLAACFELHAALQCADPTTLVSSLPIHQDGTCNGLQHYAALGGDSWGAEQVNLAPADRPADVYSTVADLVRQSIVEDAASTEPTTEMAKIMVDKITRKVVKQTVMTNVYGVTYMGAKAQVQKQIDAAYPNIQEETGIDSRTLSAYVAKKIFVALSTMFRGAHDIQYWLGECASRICRSVLPEAIDELEAGNVKPARLTAKVAARVKIAVKHKRALHQFKPLFKSTLVWTTPMRMPVVQPYRETEMRVIETSLQALQLCVPEVWDPVHARKQLQGFPPNFIHSLDASHMLLSAIECSEAGLEFAAVHDSFWTHAADVDVMNKALRNSFIRIHSEDVVKRLASEFEARHKGAIYMAMLKPGTPLTNEIAALRVASGLSQQEELIQERLRYRLLHSSDPEEVRKGQEMVTPATLYEKSSEAQDLIVDEEGEEISQDVDGEAASNHDDLEADEGHPSDAASPKKPKTSPKKVPIWLPMAFPPLPIRGDFDVSQVKDSQYFFS